MKKYPYTFEEYKRATEREYLEKFCDKDRQGGLKILKDKEIQELIKKGYNGNKYSYEHNIRDISKDINNEVSGTVYSIFLLS